MIGLRNLALTTAALALTAGSAAAGGIEWMSPTTGVGLLFEKGKHVEFSLGSVSPSVSGSLAAAPAVTSGDMTKNFMPYSLGIKIPLGSSFDFAFSMFTPNGAKVEYPTTAIGYPYAGSTATITDREYQALLRYKMPSNFSVYAGLRMDEVKGEANVIAGALNYTLTTQKDASSGWLAGIAYEKPDIALRVALTYSSPISHRLSTAESAAGLFPPPPYTTAPSSMTVEMPKSWTLDFQTGVAPKTLLFGSVEWRNWKAFDISPTYYSTAAGLNQGPLVSYNNDTVTWKLGLGRQLTDTLSGAVSLGYEKQNGGFSGNLGPTDGYKSISLALIYTKNNVKITTGISYAKIGDAKTAVPGTPPGATPTPANTLSNFSGNHALGVGVKVGYSF